MERVDDVRVRGMVFGALFVMLEEARTHQGWRGRPKAGGVARQHLLTEVGERRAAERRARSGKGELDEALIEPDDFENLRPLVSIERRDPHLCHHLEGAVLERLHVALLGGPPIAGVALEVAGRRQRLDRCQSQPRTDRLRPIAEETDDVVDLAGFVRLDQEARPAAQPPPHQMVVHGSDGEQCRDRRARLAGRQVGHDQDGGSGAHRLLGIPRQPLAGGLQSRRAVGDGEGRVEVTRREGGFERAQRLQPCRIEDK